MDAGTTSEAKGIASRFPRYLHKNWYHIKLTVMKMILIAKADYCPEFRTALIDSSGKYIVECTQYIIWASGLPPRYTDTTKPSYYPGSNMLGFVLEYVRIYLLKEAVIFTLLESEPNYIPHPPPLSPHVAYSGTSQEISTLAPHTNPPYSDPLPSEPRSADLFPSQPLSTESIASKPWHSEPLPSELRPSEPMQTEPQPSEPIRSKPLTS